MDVFFFRAVERYLTLIIGGFCIFLGYLLFLRVDVEERSSGELTLPGDIGLVFTQVGPGVFFALFGAAVLVFSLRMQLTYRRELIKGGTAGAESGVSTPPSEASVVVTYLNATEQISDDQSIQSARSRHLQVFRTIDRICGALDNGGEDESVSVGKTDLIDFSLAAPRVKQALMLTVWDTDWGDYGAFSRWVMDGCKDPPPKAIEMPARFYLDKPG